MHEEDTTMHVPLDIQFRNMSASEAVEAAVRRRVAKLEHLAGQLISCRVTIEAPHRHHRQGNLFSVSVDLHQSGRETLANRTPQSSREHEDVYVALRDAFNAAKRQVVKHLRTQRGDVKRHSLFPRPRLVPANSETGVPDTRNPADIADEAYAAG
jgi:ribosomal subunit interface protein